MSDLTDYYRRRAPEYDAVYAKPERQDDLRRLRSTLVELVRDQRVLEVAAGTGYWTAALTTTARSVLATDLTEETLAVAREREYPGNVSFRVADAYRLDEVGGEFDVVFAGFFWSHVLRAEAADFLRKLARRVRAGGWADRAHRQPVRRGQQPADRVRRAGWRHVPAAGARGRFGVRGAEELSHGRTGGGRPSGGGRGGRLPGAPVLLGRVRDGRCQGWWGGGPPGKVPGPPGKVLARRARRRLTLSTTSSTTPITKKSRKLPMPSRTELMNVPRASFGPA